MNWINIEDELPPAQERVVFLREGAIKPTFGFKEINDRDSVGWIDMIERDRDGLWLDVYDVTHWLLLPKPPSRQGTANPERRGMRCPICKQLVDKDEYWNGNMCLRCALAREQQDGQTGGGDEGDQ